MENMENKNELFSRLQILEEELLNSEVRASKERLNELIADEFVEFGTSGKQYDKQMVLKDLPSEKGSYLVTASDFAFNEIEPGLVEITYQSVLIHCGMDTWQRGAKPAQLVSQNGSSWAISGRWYFTEEQGLVNKFNKPLEILYDLKHKTPSRVFYVSCYQSNVPPTLYSVTRVSKKFFSLLRSTASLIHGNGFS